MRPATTLDAPAAKLASLSAADLVLYLQRPIEPRAGLHALRVRIPHPGAAEPWPSEIIERALASLYENREADLFALAPGDYVIVCNNLPRISTAASLAHLGELFPDDREGPPSENGMVSHDWFNLGVAQDLGRLVAAASEAAAVRHSALGHGLRPITAGDLPAISERLLPGTLSPLMRRQSILCIEPAGAFVPLFSEIYISIADFQRVFAPGIAVAARPNLFRYLTEIFDQAVLDAFTKGGGGSFAFPDLPFSLNLNLSTLQTASFEQFRAAVGDPSRVLIELHIEDVLANFEAFLQQRERLRQLGFRFVIDGLSLASLDLIDPSPIEADFVKVLFRAGDASDAGRNRLSALRAVFERTGLGRLIFARIESEDLLSCALGLGISRFQGRFIDRLVEALANKRALAPCRDR